MAATAPTAAPAAAPAEDEQLSLDEQAALLNRVTGGNVSKRSRSTAVKARALRQSVAAMSAHIEQVEKGNLYFIQLEPEVDEGELRVGLARADDDATEGTFRVTWFSRIEWLRSSPCARWSLTPTFRLARDPHTGRVGYTSLEAVTDVLPLLPLLTPASLTPQNSDRPRLLASSVRALTELCRQRDLINPVAEGEGG